MTNNSRISSSHVRVKMQNLHCIKSQEEHSALLDLDSTIGLLKELQTTWEDGRDAFTKQKKSTIAVVSVYQTVENTTHGPTSVHAQQVATLFQEGRKVTPRQAFLQDLNNVIRILQRQRIQVIIAGDLNSEVTLHDISQLMNSNVNLEVFSDPEAIASTYRLGSNCIDHVLASSTIASNITSIEYLQYPNECYTDHTPILITIKTNTRTSMPSKSK